MKDNKPKQNSTKKKSVAAEREAKILAFWKKGRIFEKSLKQESPNGEFVFYDGPPFATGLPHAGNLLSSVAKDVIPRYKTMRGYHVRRRWGWDCHGLPIENMIEKRLGLKEKKDIETMGIEKFNEACRSSVLEYVDEWEEYVDRLARWVEYRNDYKTMDVSFMESVWWGLKEMHKKGLVYEGRKVLLYCPRCETPLAKAEVQMDNSYKDVTEDAVTVKFKDTERDEYYLAWTTTPWTLPGNMGLAVDVGLTYARVEQDGAEVWLAKDLMEQVVPGARVLEEKKGSELVGRKYEPLYTYNEARLTDEQNEAMPRAYTIYGADFVHTDEGTGIVHTAVIYGEDDYQLGMEHKLPQIPLLDERGHFNSIAPAFIQRKYIKQAEKPIMENLEKRGLLFAKAANTHSYPHCHRCDTPLIYNAITSWFINIQKVKAKLLKQNEKINWVPDHLKHGQFHNIVKSAPDWTISRNRYWASALPIWKCVQCPNVEVVGSIEELKKKTASSGNTYFTMRHGEAESNIKREVSSVADAPDHLTDKGRAQVEKAAKRMRKGDFDLIVSSPFVRTRETAEIIAKKLDLSQDQLIFDDLIAEFQPGDEFQGKTWHDYHDAFTLEEQFEKSGVNGETRFDVHRRAGELLYKLEEKYTDTKILIVSHEGVLDGVEGSARGAGQERAQEISANIYHDNGELRKLEFTPLPHNRDYETDLHRPYIDRVLLKCTCGEKMERIPEVVDGWFEAGSMSYAENHYPFENKREFKKRFPADYVTEYIAQTRTWYYYMHAVAVILFGKPAFYNVLNTGNILAQDGSKMSKSKGNYTDPLILFDEYGADAFRYYLMTSTLMQGEDLNFTNEDIKEVHNRLINIFYNTYRFFETYQDEFDASYDPHKSTHVLDKWILAKLYELRDVVTERLDAFDTIRSGRPLREFVNDFSTWYVRRSRERFKGGDDADKKYAVSTTRHVLKELAKLMAPFTPFIAEHVYRGVGGTLESVHLEYWPEKGVVDKKVLEDMELVREVVSLALEARATAKIKVRQPLAKLELSMEVPSEYLSLIKDEVNVKEVAVDTSLLERVVLDTTITPELAQEGMVRDTVRHIQQARKVARLSPKDVATLTIDTNDKGKTFIEMNKRELMEAAKLSDIKLSAITEGSRLELEGFDLTIKVAK